MSELPTKDAILKWIADNPGLTAKRDIAKAFGIKGALRIELKRMLKEMAEDGHLEKKRHGYRDPEKLPPVTVLTVLAPTADGDLYAKPMEWHGEGAEPRILILPRDGDPALTEGDRLLGRLTETPGEEQDYTARMIRRIAAAPNRVLGVYRRDAEGGRIVPVQKGEGRQWTVAKGAENGARDGELVEAEQAGPKGRLGLPKARIVRRLGDPAAPKSVSLIAIHEHGIPDAFPQDVLDEADAAKPVGLKGREDLQDIDLLTIDPEDARDRDDAVLALPDDEATNPGGFVLWVAIADVAAYVRPGSALDREARLRGNSTYFPDRVVPMLPDRLSGDLCSLHQDVPRAVIAVRMRINAAGEKIGHDFHRGLMRSRGSLAYREVQAALDGAPSDRTEPLLPTLRTLYDAYAALRRARESRQPLDLDLPERRIELDEQGNVTSVAFKERLDAHRLIEEFMVLANVAAAETLVAKKTPLLFRVHEEPDPERLEALREVAEASGLTLAKGQVLKTAHLNRLLSQAEGTDEAELINMATLRAMTQAYYNPENFGHFGLALRNYAHFTSPIRRYSDLIVHRALISAHKWGDDGLSAEDEDTLERTAELISQTERRSMAAERDTVDRYLAAYLADRIGTEIGGRVAGISRAGLFVKLDGTGADALVPMSRIGGEYWHYDRDSQSLMGADSGTVITIGQRALVRLEEAAPVSGGLIAELLTLDDAAVGRGPAKGRGKGRPPRRPGEAKRKKGVRDRKVRRSRTRH
ncbi:ribonuclease R [Wenxinia marina]|uniref:Ribonuclease R n=1 Tax=Wenxinia marina DSM 24838 TaxID=1123501 RepID=A0A0D0QG82_9RHOB|nr:ribonuclease R [Wenxinia marina]KIQ71262.1 RNAse R [Wenxinia marina DSM 24838]GGL73329.1 ribonuclease R [Wenxinia marina]